MASYHIQIDERTSLGKGIIALLRSMPHVVTFENSDENTKKQRISKHKTSLK